MAITITVPDTLAEHLWQQAQAQQRSVEDVALGILREALEPAAAFPAATEVVARIRATKSQPHNLRRARGSLADALRAMPDEAGFDLAL
jgi:hypothetical protein